MLCIHGPLTGNYPQNTADYFKKDTKVIETEKAILEVPF